MGFGDFSLSMLMRDTIERIVKETVELSRPRYRYAVVNTIDRLNYKCTVTYNGESNPVTVSMGSVQPSIVGQTVRVEGIGTDKFITEVMGIAAPRIIAASETVAGIVELATSAETITGTDPNLATTPAGVKAATNALGTIGAWTAYTPTLSGISGSTWALGTGGINDCKWRYEGDLIRVQWKFVLGTGFTFPTDPCFTHPVTAKALAHRFMVYCGVGSIFDSVTTGQEYMVHAVAANDSVTKAMLACGISPMGAPGINPTSPFTWKATQTLQGEYTFRPA